MKHAVSIALAFAVCLMSVGCQHAALSEQDKAAIKGQHEQYAQTMNTQSPEPAAMLKAYYTPDAKVLPPNMPAMQNLDDVAKMMTAPGGVAKNFKIDAAAIDGHGDLAYATGTWEGDFNLPGGGMAHDKGKFLETWRKQADGSWKATHDIWNSDTPAGFAVPTGDLKADAGAELKNLAWFAGTWQFEFNAQASPFGPAGKGSTTMDCRWFVNGQSLVCRNDGTMPTGPYHELMILSYDAASKGYTAYDLDNAGVATPFALAFANNTWTMNYDLKMGGKSTRLRITITDITKDACKFKQELSTGGAWTTIGDGSSKRVGG